MARQSGVRGGGGFVRGQLRGKNFVFHFRVEVFSTKFLRNLLLFPLFVHPQCPSNLRDDGNAALVRYFLAIRQEGGPMDKESLAKVSHK